MKDISKKPEFRLEPSVLKEVGFYTFCITIFGYAAAYSYEVAFLAVFQAPASSVQVGIGALFQAAAYMIMATIGLVFIYVVLRYLADRLYFHLADSIKGWAHRAGKKYGPADEPPLLEVFRQHTPIAGTLTAGVLLPYYAISDRIEVMGYRMTEDWMLLLIIVATYWLSFWMSWTFTQIETILKVAVLVGVILTYLMTTAGSYGKQVALGQTAYWTASIQGADYVLIKDYGDRLLLAKLDQKGKLTRDIMYSYENDVTLTTHSGSTSFYERFIKK